MKNVENLIELYNVSAGTMQDEEKRQSISHQLWEKKENKSFQMKKM